MRIARVASAALFTVIALAAAPARTDTVPRAILRLRIATGCTAWKHLRFVQVDGYQRGEGLDGPFRDLLDARDGRFVQTSYSRDLSSAEGYDGRIPWERDFSATTHVMDAPSAIALAKSQAWLASYGWCVPASAAYRKVGPTIVATPVGGASIELRLDESTGLLKSASLRYDENHEIANFSDWRDVNHAVVAFTVQTVDPEDQDSAVQTIRSFKPLAALPLPGFTPPPTQSRVVLPAGLTSVRVPYVDDGDKPIVEVTIDGKGPFPFVLDSGGHFILTTQTAQRLGLQGRGSASSTNVNVVQQVSFTRVAHLGIGPARVDGMVAEIDSYGFNKLERGPRSPKAGWLGMEFFERFSVKFDPITHTIVLRPLTAKRPTPAGTRLPLFFDGDSPLVGCTVANISGSCIVDTGNASSTIIAPIWAQREGLASRFSRGLQVQDERLSRATVAIGSFVLRDALVRYTPLSSPNAERFNVEAAALSEHLIGGFVATFDYARRGLWLQRAGPYRPSAFNRSGIIARKRPDGQFVVRQILMPSPARGAGIEVGDRILSWNGVASSQLSGADFVARNAQRGSVTLVVGRGTRQFHVTIVMRNDLLPTRS